MERVQFTELSAQNISTSLLVSTYIATGNKELIINISLSSIFGDGQYLVHFTRQLLGSGLVYQSPTSSVSVPSGTTTISFCSPSLVVNNTDVIKVYITGLVSDTSVSVKTEIFDVSSVSDPLLNAVPGIYASGTAGAVLGNIAGASVSIVSPVAANGTSISLMYGDDYVAADNRALVFSSLSGPVLTGGTIALRIQCATTVVSAAGVITGAHSCYVELTDTQVATIGIGVWRYDLQATLVTSANIVTLVSGHMIVSSDVR